MDVALQAHRPVTSRDVFQKRSGLKLNPFLRSSHHGRFSHFVQFSSWPKVHPASGVSYRVFADAAGRDYWRRKPRRMANSRTSGSFPKGFGPKSPVGTSTQKRDQRSIEDNKHLESSKSSELAEADKTVLEVKVDSEKQQAVEVSEEEEFEEEITDETSDEVEGSSLVREVSAVAPSKQGVQNRSIRKVSENDTGILQKKEAIKADDENVTDEVTSKGRDKKIMKRDYTATDESVEKEKRLAEEASRKLKLEIQARLRREEIERLAEERLSRGEKLFVYPRVVKADADIEVFFNRSLSTLENEQDVLIMGAFNDWRWKSFTRRLNKTDIRGDWWSCVVHVPEEAYKMDFVFFNGQSVYDNNDTKDFCVPVEGRMDAFAFEDFLLEEKRRELEKLAKEQAEREREAEEQRRIEAEKAAREADRAQARKETEERRQRLQELMKNAARSVENVWYIEPSNFGGGDLVSLYYNKNSGPLAESKEIWIHGGYNNWKEGPSIVARLVRSEKKVGDWWCATVLVPDRAFVLDWVFADGPPQKAILYDNNLCQDFHAIVPKPISEELYWAEEENQIFKKLQEERRLREEEKRAKAEKTARMKAETKERTLKSQYSFEWKA